jgi:hypothetical protein
MENVFFRKIPYLIFFICIVFMTIVSIVLAVEQEKKLYETKQAEINKNYYQLSDKQRSVGDLVTKKIIDNFFEAKALLEDYYQQKITVKELSVMTGGHIDKNDLVIGITLTMKKNDADYKTTWYWEKCPNAADAKINSDIQAIVRDLIEKALLFFKGQSI